MRRAAIRAMIQSGMSLPGRFDPNAPTASRRPRSGVTVGDVVAAVTTDEGATAMFGAIYHKLFEAEGARQGPDHFVFVRPSQARCEIRDAAKWVGARFRPPGCRVPKQTPFGYLSDRWDGWCVLFAAVIHGADEDLKAEFARSIAAMSWSASASSGSGARGVQRSRVIDLPVAAPGAGEVAVPAPVTAPASAPVATAETAEVEAPRRAKRSAPTVAESLEDLERARRDLDEEIARVREKRAEAAVAGGEEELTEEERRREAVLDRELARLKFAREAMQRELATTPRRAREVHASLRGGRTGAKLYAPSPHAGEVAAMGAEESTAAPAPAPTPTPTPTVPRSSPALM